MILYFANRNMDIIGQASTVLAGGLTVTEDLKTEDVETGVAVFECRLPYDKRTRDRVGACTEAGNYILRSSGAENEFYTIIETEIDTKAQAVYIYAEDAGMDLINEVVGGYAADAAYPISHYIEKYAAGPGFQIGVNEAAGLTRQLSWDSEATVTERIDSIAAQFDGCEVSYSFDVKGLAVTRKYINIYRRRGKDLGAQLGLNRDVDRIVTTKSIANLATALQCTGGKSQGAEEPVTLLGYAYDDGDFYVDGAVLKSRKALERWSRYQWREGSFGQAGGHITKLFADTGAESQAALCAAAITELTKIRDMEMNYEVDIAKLPDNVKIGDRINIIDNDGKLYLSTRILRLEISAANQTQKATLGEYLIKGSGISQKVADLAAQLAQESLSAARALQLANAAKNAAAAAQEQADSALREASNANTVADEATAAANTATQSADAAAKAAGKAQTAVGTVEAEVAGLEATITGAQAAAEQAWQAAQTAETKAGEAKTAAGNAQLKAEEAERAAGTAHSTAEEAQTNAAAAVETADTAKEKAAAAETTAAAAKADAAKAQQDVSAFGESLDTLSTTMTADYARKTDLTETQAALQTQITQNAGQITSTAQKVTEIDETANNAAQLAGEAGETAAAAQAKADAATGDAAAAAKAAGEAAAAAGAAQSEVDTAKTAAATAKNVADKAQTDLAAAKADLATVASRVGTTEADITAAQTAVDAAQKAADKAKADAAAAAGKAGTAQSTADTAAANAAAAQGTANEAASNAALAQKTADAAKGDAAAAQQTADAAASAAGTAQTTANTAKANAETAQTKANAAANAAAAAQTAANDADAKAAAAATGLTAAQKNLADVTTRVGATEEEVTAAQTAVTAAQAAAEKAKNDAAAAQSTADTAKANAGTAQTAANTAKTAADNAQAAANAAKTAADNAQKAADALAVRVTAAETKITQNADAIKLAATKTEVAQTLGGYYTKTQADAAIQISANTISQTVSSTYATKQAVNEIQVGGRNLITASKTMSTRTHGSDTGGITVSHTNDYTRVSAITAGGRNVYWTQMNTIVERVKGEAYTVSVDVRCSKLLLSNKMYWYEDGNGKGLNVTLAEADKWQRVFLTYTKTSVSSSGMFLFGFTGANWDIGTTLDIRNLKFETGNKPTDWTPAPEDMQGEIDDTNGKLDGLIPRVEACESNIEQTAKEIRIELQTKYVTNDVLEDVKKYTTTFTSEQINFIRETLNGRIDGTNDLVNANEAKLREYIRFDGARISLGRSDSAFTAELDNEKLSFKENGQEIAYISNRRMYITDAVIKNSLQIGRFVWRPRDNGNLDLFFGG